MSVTETLKGLGAWSLVLEDAPQELTDAIRYFGHLAIHTGRYDYRVAGDAALTSSRYTGVVRGKAIARDEANDSTKMTLSGAGMALWLGDEDKKGDVFETLVTITAQTFENSIRALLPASGSIVEGTLFNIGQNFTGSFVFMSPRECIDYVCTTLGAEWTVSGDGKISAGLASDLFVTNPKAVVVRKAAGTDMALRALLGTAATTQDVDDFTTRVLLLANGTAGALVSASADINPGTNPYKDIHGNTVKMTRLVSESTTDTGNAAARAQLALNQYTDTRDALTLAATDYDIKGDIAVGDYIWVQDAELSLVDTANEIYFKGQRFNPMKLRLTEMTFPVTADMSAGYRDWTGKWWNLTDYIVAETAGSSTLVVGGYNRSLTAGADGGAAGSRPQPDTSVPDVTVWVTPFIQSVYQSAINGNTRAQVQLKWLRPNNVDASSITDGDHYEIRYRNSSIPLFPVTWNQLGATWGSYSAGGVTWDHPIAYPTGPWNYMSVPWSELTALLQELLPNMPYEAEIRAVDGAVPSNYGAWSSTTTFQTSGDTLPPATPAPPSVAASRIAAQVTHTLGRSDGGTYNLDADLHHLEVHGQYEPNFTPDGTTLLGKVIANNGMITGQVPAVGTVPIESTVPVYFKVIAVDNDGNASQPSTAVMQTAMLIDDAHISNLTVSKVTAGTISADWIVGARIATAFTGARVEMNPAGLDLWSPAGSRTVHMDSATGNFDSVGSIASGLTGTRVVINPNQGLYLPEIRLYPSVGSSYALINAFTSGGNIAGMGLNSGSPDGIVQSTVYVDDGGVSIGIMTVNGPPPFRGGYGDFNNSYAVVGFFKSATGIDAYMRIYSDSTPGFKGKWRLQPSEGPTTMLWVDSTDFNAFALVTLGFGSTLAQNPAVSPIFNSYGGNDNKNVCHLSGLSATGVNLSTQWLASGPSGRWAAIGFQF